MTTPLPIPLLAIGLAFGLAAPLPVSATTQDDVLSAHILSGWRTPQNTQMAAVRLDLAPGWKTYWRSPGEAGIPPQFDWSNSTNLKAVVLHWPTPEVFETNGMTTIGYHDRLVLPVELIAKDPTKPVIVRAEIELGICRDICMPAAVTLAAEIASTGAKGSGPDDILIEKALNTQPMSAKAAGLRAINCRIEPIRDGLKLTATMSLPGRGGEETVAFELDDPSIWIAEAETRRDGGVLVSSTELVPPDGRPFALDRSKLRLTIISPVGAVQIEGCPGG